MAFATLTRVLSPLLGYLAALGVYWFVVLTPLLIWHRHRLVGLIAFRWPSRWPLAQHVVLFTAVAVVGVLAVTTSPIPIWIVTLIVLAAITNGTLEEFFWRGVMLPANASFATALSVLALFVGWHIALLFAVGVTVTGGAAGLLGGAAIGGALWTWARLDTGKIGFCVASHVGLNLFAFSELCVRNLTTITDASTI